MDRIIRNGQCIARYAVLSALISLAACNSGDLNNASSVTPDRTASALAQATTSPVDVLKEFVQRSSVGQAHSPGNNLFVNSDFEDGTDGWNTCNPGSIGLSGDAYNGKKALEIAAGNCVYQSLEITSIESLSMSCYSRVVESDEWTGMGIGFWDENWNPISETAATLVSGQSWARYDVQSEVPDTANYVSMWFYSETDALLDNCTLLPTELIPEPPENSNENLLENAEFNDVTNGSPSNWQGLCGGGLELDVVDGESQLLIDDGTCALQSLSASDLNRMEGEVFELACELDYSSTQPNTSWWATMSLTLDGEEHRELIHRAEGSRIRLTVLGPDTITSGYVSIYNENEQGSLKVHSCSLQAFDSGSGEQPVDPANNLLVNGGFDLTDANNKPNAWSKGCNTSVESGSWEVISSPFSAGAMELSTDEGGLPCIRQYLSTSAISILANNTFTLSCDAWNQSTSNGSAWITISYDGYKSHQILFEPTGFYEPFTLSGRFDDLTFAAVTIRGSQLHVDNCSIVATGEATGRVAIELTANIDAYDTYQVIPPYTFDIRVTNVGDSPLTNMSYTADDVSCTGSASVMLPGETIIEPCMVNEPLDEIGYFSFLTTATATGPDGQTVSDEDSAGYQSTDRPSTETRLKIKPKKATVIAGENAVFLVSVAALGANTVIDEVMSDHPNCGKLYATPLVTGQYDIYECVIPAIQETTTVEVVLGVRDESATVYVGSQ